jgi:acyl CoA:acetate/3-ketoacid CoA transferase alpha subunit
MRILETGVYCILEEAITGDYSLVRAWKVRTQSPYMIAHGGRTYNGHHTRDWISDDMRILETGVSRAGDCILEEAITGDYSLVKAWKVSTPHESTHIMVHW